MKENTPKRLTAKQRQKVQPVAPVMSDIELARLGGGQVAYIKTLSSDEALQMFPAIEDLPRGINLYALHAADGTPIALTDTRQAALSHAMDGELEIASIH
ncbi:MAG TPA: DUF1150 domain-containing protein [Hyphomicrobium sp.]|nr:DUF1150 domain-containing protein [Hyphomicrobium sp.]